MPNGQRATTTRSISASEIARNVKHFETWSSLQGCQQVAFSDIPGDFKNDVSFVFDFEGKLPLCLVDKTSRFSKRLSKLAPALLRFLRKAYCETPSLFSDAVADDSLCDNILPELGTVFLAWSQLERMRKTNEKWSEADYAANVYNVIRSPAVQESAYRTQCSVHLPQHLSRLKPTLSSLRVLKTRTLVPDGAIFVRATAVRHLSSAMNSAYCRIKAHASTAKACKGQPEYAFRYQATPCAQPQQTPCFEFASSFWEDKKPSCLSLEHAYRQNRMACTASLRHLNSLHIKAPVFGLVFADGKVKAHTDWCSEEEGNLSVFSAAYPGAETTGKPVSSEFFEWDLDKPADILSVFLLVRNLDSWTASSFRERVDEGVEALVKSVLKDKKPYVPWKCGDSTCEAKKLRTSSLSNIENTPPSSVATALSVPKRRAARAKAKN